VVAERDESRLAYFSAINTFLQQVHELPVSDRLAQIKVHSHTVSCSGLSFKLKFLLRRLSGPKEMFLIVVRWNTIIVMWYMLAERVMEGIITVGYRME